MEHYVKSVVPIIESNYNSFTNAERNIADFFIQNKEMRDFSAKSVAEMLFVSEASLSRFAKKCGYQGYREFIYQYRENFSEKTETITGNTRKVLDAYQEILNKTYNLVDETQIMRVCEAIAKANRVKVCGIGSSGIAANEMQLRFMRIGVDIDAMDHSDMMKMQAVFQRKNDLVIGISISGEKEEILFMLKEAHRRGARTILITAQYKAGFAEFCDEVVLFPSLLHLNHGNVISPQFPILIMTDIIFSYYIEQDAYRKETLHEETLRALGGTIKVPGAYIVS